MHNVAKPNSQVRHTRSQVRSPFPLINLPWATAFLSGDWQPETAFIRGRRIERLSKRGASHEPRSRSTSHNQQPITLKLPNDFDKMWIRWAAGVADASLSFDPSVSSTIICQSTSAAGDGTVRAGLGI